LGTLTIDFAFETGLPFARDFITGMAGFAIAAVLDVSNPKGMLRAIGGGANGCNGMSPLELAGSGRGALGGGGRKAA